MQFPDLSAKTNASSDDIVPIRDVSSNTDKRTTVAGLAAAVAGALPDASITAAKLDRVWYEELGRTIVSTAGDTIIVSIPARKYLRIEFHLIPTAGTINARARFNGDATTAYGRQYTYNATPASETGATFLQLAGDTLATTQFGVADIINLQTSSKLVTFMEAHENATTPFITHGAGKWANTTAQITEITFVNQGTGDYAVGSQVVVLGHN